MMRSARAPARSRYIGISELKFRRVVTVSLNALASDPIVRVFRHQLMDGRPERGGSCGKETCLRTRDHKDLTGPDTARLSPPKSPKIR
jgi:hypothetical protein